MFEEVMKCQYCNKTISTRFVHQDIEPDILSWQNNEDFYSYKVCKNCAVHHLEQQVLSLNKREGELWFLCKERKKQIENLQTILNKYKRFFKKQQARVNAFAQEKK